MRRRSNLPTRFAEEAEMNLIPLVLRLSKHLFGFFARPETAEAP
jgi:hypothetical protein